MRSTRLLLILLCVVLGAGHSAVEGQPKYGVTLKTANRAALATARTYVWIATRPSFDKGVDASIVAAVDRQLAARGLTRLGAGPSDAVVTYASVTRTDLDTKKHAPDGSSREFTVATLELDMRGGADQRALFSVRMDSPIEWNRATIAATIDAAVAAMFEKYPAQRR